MRQGLYGLVGLCLLLAAMAWVVSPLARVQLRRLATAALTVAVVVLIAAVAWHELHPDRG
jgi:hypothetical protein